MALSVAEVGDFTREYGTYTYIGDLKVGYISMTQNYITNNESPHKFAYSSYNVIMLKRNS